MDVEAHAEARCLRLNRGLALVAALAGAVLAGCYSLGGTARMPREQHYAAGRAFLVGDEREAPGYGLYSYLLFAGPPPPAARQRYLQAVTAYLEYLPPIAALTAYRSSKQLNITYLPVTTPPPADIAAFRPKFTDPEASATAASWILDHYNYPRTAMLLSALGRRKAGDGPYLISALQPLSTAGDTPGPHLRQDLSSLPPDFTRAWFKEFLQQAASPGDWDNTSLSRFALTLRTAAASSAEVLPSVRDSVRDWIRLVQ
jgi:hypothetical protein